MHLSAKSKYQAIAFMVLLIGMTVLGSCNSEEEAAGPFTYRFTGTVIGLDGAPLAREQNMRVVVSELCGFACEEVRLLGQDFTTDMQGQYAFEMESDQDLAGFIYSFLPLDGPGLYVKVENRGVIGKPLMLQNEDETTVADASRVVVTFRSQAPATLALDNCPLLNLGRGCNPQLFRFDSPVDTVVVFNYPFELTPSVDVTWNSTELSISETQRIELEASEVYQLSVTL